MRIPLGRTSASHRTPRRIPAHFCWTRPALILCAALAFAIPAFAAPSVSATGTSAHPQPRHHQAARIRRVAQKKPAAPVPPPLPPAPNWPINSQPKPASVTWDSRGLSVVASNSSLADILHQVSIATGVHVQGFSADQRIFGTYGPGPAREVLSDLLSGAGYNVLILGGLGSAPPTRIVLSARPTGPTPPAPPMQQSDEDDQGYPMDAPPLPPVDNNAPGYQPSPPVRTPQQIMEEMERRRQQQLQQQQQQQQPQANPNSRPGSPQDQP